MKAKKFQSKDLASKRTKTSFIRPKAKKAS